METITLPGTDVRVSRIALGTWSIGGWMWGGTEEEQAIRTICSALDRGITTIDTAPVYGYGTAEERVGKALAAHGRRDEVVVATKVGLEWNDDGDTWRNSTPQRVRAEIEGSLRRLGTDYVDVYQVHWPDLETSFDATAREMEKLRAEGKVRALGVSNYSPAQMDAFRAAAPLHVCQPPYNLFEREAEDDVLPYCEEHDVAVFAYGALCRGLLSGEMTRDREFTGDDLRRVDPKFQGARFDQYLAAADRLDHLARELYGKRLIHLALRWILDRGVEVALWGARKPEQLDPVDEIDGWSLNDDTLAEIDRILNSQVQDPVGPEFMAPPEHRDEV